MVLARRTICPGRPHGRLTYHAAILNNAVDERVAFAAAPTPGVECRRYPSLRIREKIHGPDSGGRF
jgi:hypothetical protein